MTRLSSLLILMFTVQSSSAEQVTDVNAKLSAQSEAFSQAFPIRFFDFENLNHELKECEAKITDATLQHCNNVILELSVRSVFSYGGTYTDNIRSIQERLDKHTECFSSSIRPQVCVKSLIKDLTAYRSN